MFDQYVLHWCYSSFIQPVFPQRVLPEGFIQPGFQPGFWAQGFPARVSAKGTSTSMNPAMVGTNNIQCSEAFGWDGKGSVLMKHLLNRTFLPSNAV